MRPGLYYSLSDSALIDDLGRLGVTLDADRFRKVAGPVASPEELAHTLNSDLRPRLRGGELDRLRVDVTLLRERWLPERPTFEMIDEWMQSGYKAQARGNDAEASRHWIRTWTAVATIARQRGFARIEEFDNVFDGTQFVFNWVQDMDNALCNAGREKPWFWEETIRIADEVLRLFPNESQLFTENKRRWIAESHAKLGRRDVSDELYRNWLVSDPAWGWGWIGWADTYFLVVRDDARDTARAEAILHQGLAVADVRDRADLLDRLAAIYEDTGRESEAAEVRRRIDEREAAPEEASVTVFSDPETGSGRVSFDFGDEGLPLERLSEIPDRARGILAATGEGLHKKVGRNERCPCGSGRKFKKCCGARNVRRDPGRGPAPRRPRPSPAEEAERTPGGPAACRRIAGDRSRRRTSSRVRSSRPGVSGRGPPRPWCP
jgi:tetratricopeptide (TPR) repeat protein